MFFHQVCGRPDGVRVLLYGEIDLPVRDKLRNVLAGVVATGVGTTELDLHEVTFLDCSGVGEFIRAHTDARKRGQTLTVSRPRGIVRRILELTGVLAVLTADEARVVRTAVQKPVPARLDLPRSA